VNNGNPCGWCKGEKTGLKNEYSLFRSVYTLGVLHRPMYNIHRHHSPLCRRSVKSLCRADIVIGRLSLLFTNCTNNGDK